MNEANLVVDDLAMKLAHAEVSASLWRARAIAAGWGQEESEDSDDLDS